MNELKELAVLRIGHSFFAVIFLLAFINTSPAEATSILDIKGSEKSSLKRNKSSITDHNPKKIKTNLSKIEDCLTLKQKEGLAQLPLNIQAKVILLAEESQALKNGSYAVSDAWEVSKNEPGVPSTPTKALKGKKVVIPTPVARKTLSRLEVAHLIKWDLARPREMMTAQKQEEEKKIQTYDNYLFQMKCNLENETKELQAMVGKSRAQYQKHLQESRVNLTENIVRNFAQFIKEATQKHGHGESLRLAMHQKFCTDLTHMLFHVPIRAEGIELNFYVNPADIDFNLKDAKGRTNRTRMLNGLNPIAPDENSKLVSFDYHHITQSQENFAPIMCLPPHLHTEELHPFNGYGTHMDEVDRSYFNIIKRIANHYIATNM